MYILPSTYNIQLKNNHKKNQNKTNKLHTYEILFIWTYFNIERDFLQAKQTFVTELKMFVVRLYQMLVHSSTLLVILELIGFLAVEDPLWPADILGHNC